MKTPNPITKDYDQATYFDRVDNDGIRCIGAALTLDESTHIVICAPDAVILSRAWKKLTTCKFDIKKAPILLYRYQTELDKLREEQIQEVKTNGFPIKGKDGVTTISDLKYNHTVDDSVKWLWYYYPHPKRAECFIEESSFVPDRKEILLGEAKRCSKEECLLLLRQNRIPRSEISGIEINTDTSELIPF